MAKKRTLGDRWVRRLIGVLVVVIAVGAGWWAGHATLVSPAPVDGNAERVVASVIDATVGQSITLNVTVSQPFTLVASNALPGVVTSVNSAPLSVGDIAYAVAGQTVRAVQGTEPFYRELSEGLSGTDVTQLQNALVTLGYLPQADGRFGAATTRAVRAWQKSSGDMITGTVSLGRIVALPAFPAQVQLDDAIAVGAVLSGNEPAVLVRVSAPSFALVLSSDQAQTVPADAVVNIDFDGRTWPAVIAGTEVGENSEVSLRLTAPDGSLVCGADCALLPGDAQISLLAKVQLVPDATGAGVPIAAVHTTAEGDTYLFTEAGVTVPVVVIASGDGLAIVTGVDVGDRIIALGAPDVAPPSTLAPAETAQPEPSDVPQEPEGVIDDGE